jgi:hypothetical membrane protein
LLLAASLVYFVEKRCFFALLTLLAAIPWVMYFLGIFFGGPALPEIISSFAIMPCYLIALWRTYRMVERGEAPPT